jgi:4-oxalmesaconate hydratase
MWLLCKVIAADNLLFASELLGAVRGLDPTTGRPWDDTRTFLDGVELAPNDRMRILADNARRVYPRLARTLGVRA